MPRTQQTVFLALLVTAQAAASVLAEELPLLAIEFSTGKHQRAMLDPKTDNEHLWLRFGKPTTYISRGFEWQKIAVVRAGDRRLSPEELIQVAANSRKANSVETRTVKIVVPSANAALPPAQPPQLDPGKSARVTTVTCEAMVENWDADVAMDGLSVQIRPVDIYGNPVTVRGVLTVELFSIHRVDQNAIPNSRGRDFRRVGEWSVPVQCESDFSGSGWVRLPFQAAHPELDWDWGPYGLVHVQFAAAGHGVFHHSIDGVRIRPYAPYRDALQQNSKARYLPSESHR